MTLMTARRQRTSERLVHLLAAGALLAYVYLPLWGALADIVHDVVRLVVFPVLTASGIAMWQIARMRRMQKRIASAARATLQRRQDAAAVSQSGSASGRRP